MNLRQVAKAADGCMAPKAPTRRRKFNSTARLPTSIVKKGLAAISARAVAKRQAFLSELFLGRRPDGLGQSYGKGRVARQEPKCFAMSRLSMQIQSCASRRCSHPTACLALITTTKSIAAYCCSSGQNPWAFRTSDLSDFALSDPLAQALRDGQRAVDRSGRASGSGHKCSGLASHGDRAADQSPPR